MRMAREEAAITQTFANYIQTFQTLDPHATLPYFHLPCMFIPPQGVRVLATAADVEALLTEVMEGLKARSYARSALMDLHVKQMSGNTALVSVSRIRYATDGRELEGLGETYTLRKTEGGWKIAVAMIHDPDTVVR
jgi:ketosteroid isomerase-like protein